MTHFPISLHIDEAWNDSTNIHFSKANLHSQAFENVESAVEVFFGTNDHISSRWYAAKDNVPTCDYTAVHAIGTLRKMGNKDKLMKLVDDLTAEHEVGADSPW